MDKIRWGVLSTAKIAREHVIPAIRRSRRGTVVALASRDRARGQAMAAELAIPKVYSAYDDLLADPNVDAVYNPLPNHLHVSWTLRAMKAGKHVLCEKPIGLNVVEAEQLASAAASHPKLKVMEAFMYRHHPQWQMAQQLVQHGRIGSLRTIHTFFSYFNDDPQNIRNQRDIGGGALMDIGCYGISLARFIFQAEPHRVLAMIERDQKTGVDRLVSALLEFFQGTSSFTCGTQLAPHQRVNIVGTKGRVEIEIPFNAPADRPQRIWLQQGGVAEEIIFDPCDQYGLEADAFAEAIQDDLTVPTPLSDAVANMRVIERLFASAEKNAWM
jgi:predicted dehydrogenase